MIRDASTKEVVAFDTVAEYPLDPVLSFVLGDTTDGDDEAVRLFYSHPAGVSQARVEKVGWEALTKVDERKGTKVEMKEVRPAPVAPVDQSKAKKEEEKETVTETGILPSSSSIKVSPRAKAESKQASPALIPATLTTAPGPSSQPGPEGAPAATPAPSAVTGPPPAQAATSRKQEPVNKPEPTQAQKASGITSDELQKALKKVSHYLLSCLVMAHTRSDRRSPCQQSQAGIGHATRKPYFSLG